MGTVDKTTHKLTCEKCGATETVTVYEEGSGYRSSWQEPPATANFSVTWEENKWREPRVVAAKCNACGADAKDETSH